MKLLNLKLIGVLFIALYCLVPLCAADLNQSNIADDNGVNGENNNIEITKVSNETKNKEDNKLKGIDYYVPLSVHVDDVTKGEKIVVEITTEDYISTCVKFFIFGPGHSELNYIFLEHGYGAYELDSSDLSPGQYRVNVYADGSNNDGQASTTFTVYP